MKKIISLIVSIVLTVSVFTTAYASGTQNEVVPVTQAEPKQGESIREGFAITQEIIQIIEEVFGLVQEEFSAAQIETGEITQEEDAFSQIEHRDAELRKMVIQYAQELAIKYAPIIDKKPFMLPLGIIEQNVDQSISYLLERRAGYDAIAKRIEAEIKKLEKAATHGENPLGMIIIIFIIAFLRLPFVSFQSISVTYRALIEAKEHYNYKLNGNAALSTEELVSK